MHILGQSYLKIIFFFFNTGSSISKKLLLNFTVFRTFGSESNLKKQAKQVTVSGKQILSFERLHVESESNATDAHVF